MTAPLSEQFGPERARGAYEAAAERARADYVAALGRAPRGRSGPTYEQPRLPGVDPGRERFPWEQTQAEFTNHPLTWFHARIRADEIPEPDDEASGVHVGTLKAAQDRIGHLTGAGITRHHGQPHTADDVARVFPVRIMTSMRNTPARALSDEGEDWNEEHHDHYYRNSWEDPGSISAVVSGPQFLKTHRQFVEDALRAKQPVPPRVAHEYAATGGRHGPLYDPALEALSTRPTDFELPHLRAHAVAQTQPSLWSGPAPTDLEALRKHLVEAHGKPSAGTTGVPGSLVSFHEKEHPEAEDDAYATALTNLRSGFIKKLPADRMPIPHTHVTEVPHPS